MNDVVETVTNEKFLIIATSIALVISIINIILIVYYKKKHGKIMKVMGIGENIETILLKYIDKVEKVEDLNIKLVEENKAILNELQKNISKQALIRYNAFDTLGRDLSFSLALLDSENTGFVISSIYSVEKSNIYIKMVKKGKSTESLSEEEEKVIEKAINREN